MALEYVIYCDESTKRGPHFSNFYGGLLVRSTDLDHISNLIQEKKDSLDLTSELKWERITLQYVEKYIEVVNLIFDLVDEDKIKFRVMFTQNIHSPTNLLPEHFKNQYFILYYFFLKQAFGLQYADHGQAELNMRVNLDNIPHNKAKVDQFKSFICSLTHHPPFRDNGIKFKNENIAEIDSKKHVLAQCLDIVLGSMQFRLNDLHLVKPAGSGIRGKRTRAKETVYKLINSRIRNNYPNFNIGISTGIQGEITNRWHHSYRHWRFVPSEFSTDTSKSKAKMKSKK